MEEQLMRPYEMFKQYYPDMMYVPENIQIWSMTNEEYGEAYCKACHILGISCENLKTAAGDEGFCAEVLKSDGKAIILINSVYREKESVSDRIIIHELSHLYYDFRNHNVETEIEKRPENKDGHLCRNGVRLWREFTAKYMAMRVLRGSYETKGEMIGKSFYSLLSNNDVIPERLGLFLANILIHERNGDPGAEILLLEKDRNCYEELKGTIRDAIEFIEKYLSPERFFNVDRDVFITLGKMITLFTYYYLQYFNRTEEFIGERS